MNKFLIPMFILFCVQLSNVIWYCNTPNPIPIVIGFNICALIWIIYLSYRIWKNK